MKRKPTPKEFRKHLERELAAVISSARRLADEYEWAHDAADAPTVGDTAHTRSYASRPTESIALSGYLEDSAKDREVRGKAAMRRELQRCVQTSTAEIVKLSNALQARASNLQKAMHRLKPGPSPRNPRFEKTVTGDTTLLRSELNDTHAAQARRQERGEDPPLICTCRMIDHGEVVEYVPTMMGRCAVHGEGATKRRSA